MGNCNCVCDIPSLKMIKDKQISNNIQYNVNQIYNIFIRNGMNGGMIFDMLLHSVDGQILISLNKKPDHYVNSLGDFYIDDRVGFRGVKEVMRIVNDIEFELMKIVKRDKIKIKVGDIVKRTKYTCNISLDKYPLNTKFQVMKMDLTLDPKYIDYEIVETTLKPFKKNWIYGGSNDLFRIKKGVESK